MLYIGLLAIILPSFVLFYIQVAERQSSVDEIIISEGKAATIFSEVSRELAGAQSVDITSSTLGTESSTLVFINAVGEEVTIDRPTVFTNYERRPDKDVPRLRYQEGLNDPVWMTDPEIEVTTWQVDAVRDSENNLTALNIMLELDVNPNTRTAAHFEASTTIALQPHTTEL